MKIASESFGTPKDRAWKLQKRPRQFLTSTKFLIEITKKSSHKELMKLKKLKSGKRKKLTSRC